MVGDVDIAERDRDSSEIFPGDVDGCGGGDGGCSKNKCYSSRNRLGWYGKAATRAVGSVYVGGRAGSEIHRHSNANQQHESLAPHSLARLTRRTSRGSPSRSESLNNNPRMSTECEYSRRRLQIPQKDRFADPYLRQSIPIDIWTHTSCPACAPHCGKHAAAAIGAISSR
jgi:hypothetical protein